MNHSRAGDADWGTPYPVPTPAASVHHDDISALVAFQRDKIGVLWSKQLTRKLHLAVHRDGEPDETWSTESPTAAEWAAAPGAAPTNT